MDRIFVVGDVPARSERARSWRAADQDPAPLRLAATVMLVREGERGLEVFMHRRVSTMAFAPSRLVFPGGRVDDADAEPISWAGRAAHAWGEALGVAANRAQALLTAAARETFEECGVLLARDAAGSPPADLASDDWEADRRRLERREISLASLFAARGLAVDADALHYRAHWITPTFEKHRYDTYFFTATVPEGQMADGATGEADYAQWHRPADVLADNGAALLPPTRICLEELEGAETCDVLADLSPVPAILPELLELDGQLVLQVRG